MFCPHCGCEVEEGTRFCDECGGEMEEAGARSEESGGREAATGGAKREESGVKGGRGRRQVSETVVLDEDGVYRWSVELGRFRNARVYFLAWKILFWAIVAALLGLLGWDGFKTMLGDGELLFDVLQAFGVTVLCMSGIVWGSFLVAGAIWGKRSVEAFEMDDQGVCHRQGTEGRGTYTEFAKVAKVKACPQRHFIRLVAREGSDRLYAKGEDFAFVLGHVRRRTRGK